MDALAPTCREKGQLEGYAVTGKTGKG
jgi:hypothetical protein